MIFVNLHFKKKKKSAFLPKGVCVAGGQCKPEDNEVIHLKF